MLEVPLAWGQPFLDVRSSVGLGTTFSILIPVENKDSVYSKN